MKLKLIDLFNLIANKEIFPKKFRYMGYCFKWCESCEAHEAIDENGDGFNIYDLLAREGSLNDEVEIVGDTAINPKKVAIGFDNIKEDDLGWTYIEEGSCKYYIPAELLNRLTSLADAVNYLLEKEGE